MIRLLTSKWLYWSRILIIDTLFPLVIKMDIKQTFNDNFPHIFMIYQWPCLRPLWAYGIGLHLSLSLSHSHSIYLTLSVYLSLSIMVLLIENYLCVSEKRINILWPIAHLSFVPTIYQNFCNFSIFWKFRKNVLVFKYVNEIIYQIVCQDWFYTGTS